MQLHTYYRQTYHFSSYKKWCSTAYVRARVDSHRINVEFRYRTTGVNETWNLRDLYSENLPTSFQDLTARFF